MGEELPNRTCSILKKSFNDVRILNAYGPTEATIVTTLVEITDDVISKYPMLPIGFPMPASKIVIEKLDPNDKEGCSFILLMDVLKENGTCVGVLKEGVFFDRKYEKIRYDFV